MCDWIQSRSKDCHKFFIEHDDELVCDVLKYMISNLLRQVAFSYDYNPPTASGPQDCSAPPLQCLPKDPKRPPPHPHPHLPHSLPHPPPTTPSQTIRHHKESLMDPQVKILDYLRNEIFLLFPSKYKSTLYEIINFSFHCTPSHLSLQSCEPRFPSAQR